VLVRANLHSETHLQHMCIYVGTIARNKANGKLSNKQKMALAAWHSGHRQQNRTEDPGFESPPGVRFLGLSTCSALVKT
jgi:hypothetical protein